MKHGKKLTVKQQNYVKNAGFEPKEWLCVKNLHDRMVLVHRITGATISIGKR